MNPDNVLIYCALFILLLAFAFGGKVFEEIRLLQQTQAIELTEQLVNTNFYPLSQQEKVITLRDYIDNMSKIQERVSKTIITKRFIDYSEIILERQEELCEREENLKNDESVVSFSTLNLHSMIANPQLPKEELLLLACLIDETFPEDEDNGLFIIELKDHGLVIDLTPMYGFDLIEKNHYQRFIDQVSEDIFEGKPVTLQVEDLVLTSSLS